MSTSPMCGAIHAPIKNLSGGYRPLTNQQICEAWQAYSSKALNGFLGFRVYLALHETDERRLACNRRRRRLGLPAQRFAFDEDRLVGEVHCLVGGAGGRHIREAFRRLKAAGLVCFSGAGVEFPSPERDPSTGSTRASAMLDRIDPRACVRERVVPIPRRTLRYIAHGVPPVVAATMLGHAMRCLWLHDDRIRATGSCSASFVAGLFHVHPRTVKRARAHLRELGWFQPIETEWWHARRYGPRAEVNLEWRDERQTTSLYVPRCTESPPHRRLSGTESPPVCTERSLPSETKQQKPPGKRRNPGTPSSPQSGSARLSNVVLEDLAEPSRLDALFKQAVSLGWVGASACERLHFHTAAAHALAAGARNPCGLFVYLVKGRRWDRLTLTAEDKARKLIKSLEESEGAADERDTLGAATSNPVAVSPVGHGLQRRRLSQLVARVATQKSLAREIDRMASRVGRRTSHVDLAESLAVIPPAADWIVSAGGHSHVVLRGQYIKRKHRLVGPAARDPVGRRSPRPSESEPAAAERVCRWPDLRTGSPRLERSEPSDSGAITTDLSGRLPR